MAGFGTEFVSLKAASDGTDFLVVWGTQNYFLEASLGAAFVRSDGGTSMALHFRQPTVPQVSVAFDGTQYLIAYDTAPYSGTGSIVVQGVSPSGDAGPSWTFTLPDGGSTSEVSVAAENGQSAVAWSDGRDPLGAFFSSLQQVDGVPLLGALGAYCPQIAWTGAGYDVVWRQLTDAGADIYAALLQLDGGVSPPGGASVTGLPPAAQADCPSLACDGAGACAVAWLDTATGMGTTFAWFSDGGATPGAFGYFAPPGGSGHAVTLGNTGAWLQSGAEVTQVALDGAQLAYFPVALPGAGLDAAASSQTQALFATAGAFTRVTAALSLGAAPSAPFDVYQPYNVEVSPTVGCGPTQCLLLWGDDRLGQTESILDVQLFGVRVDPDSGDILDSQPFVVLSNATTAYLLQPAAIAASASGYLVVTTGNSILYPSTIAVLAQRLDYDGGWLDPSPVTLGPASFPTSLVGASSNGTDYLAVWSAANSNGGVVSAGRVLPDGTTPDFPGLPLDSQLAFPAVASNGSDYLVVWSTSLPDGGDSVRSRAVYDDGGVGPLYVVDEHPSIALGGVVFAGRTYVAVWSDLSSWFVSTLGSDGAPGNLFAFVAPSSPLVAAPQVVPAPYGVFALFAAGADAGSLEYDGCAVTLDGGRCGPAFAFATVYPPLASVGLPTSMAATQGGALVASPEFDTPTQTSRTYFRLLTLDNALGQPCQADAECASGVCDSNVCCAAPGACMPPPPIDAGNSDAGKADAGLAQPSASLGCGCGSSSGPLTSVLLAALSWAAGRLRRRARPVRPRARAASSRIVGCLPGG